MVKKFGLDFGTTNSSIAIEENGVGKVLEIDTNALDPRVVRSMLYFNRREIIYKETIARSKISMNLFEAGDFSWEGEFKPLIGQRAVNQYMSENRNRKEGVIRTIFTGRIIDTESLMEVKGGAGAVREYYEEIDYGTGRLLQALKTALKSPYYKGTTIFGQFFTLEELIATFVGIIKKKAEKLLGEEVSEILCGRPVHFLEDSNKDRQTQERLEAALRNVGFKKIEFEYEPIAAVKQFLSTTTKKNQTVFCFDFGGGTLDTAIVRSDREVEVLATDGIYIGGDLLNADIMKAKLWSYFGSQSVYGEMRTQVPLHVYEPLNSWFGIPNLNNKNTLDLLDRLKYKNSDAQSIDRLIYFIKANLGFDLYEGIEGAKKQLSFDGEAMIFFRHGVIDIAETITREEFEEIIAPRVEAIREVVLRTLKNAKLEASQIDVVVRTGGSSLIPIFEKMLVEIFGREKIRQFETFTSIAAGLALE